MRHAEHRLARVVPDDDAERFEIGEIDRARQPEHDVLLWTDPAHELVERAVVRDLPFVDDDDARTQRGDVVHVVAREDQRRAVLLVGHA